MYIYTYMSIYMFTYTNANFAEIYSDFIRVCIYFKRVAARVFIVDKYGSSRKYGNYLKYLLCQHCDFRLACCGADIYPMLQHPCV